MKQLWQKETSQLDNSWFYTFTTAEDRRYDTALIPFDILNNCAQTYVLTHAGLLSHEEQQQLITALKKLYTLWEQGDFALTEEDEDVHSAVEKWLTDRLGEVGQKIHAGRSRNDQVVTDIRLFLKQELLDSATGLVNLQQQLLHLAETYPDTWLPGFTHTQPAMPTSVDAWCAGFLDAFQEDLTAIRHAYETIDQCPLGSAAGFGVPMLSINRELAAQKLGFAKVQGAVNGVQLSRGAFELRVVHALGYATQTLNRLASELIWLTNPSLGIVTLSDDQVSGSSIMPQKRNPDAWELIRASAHEQEGYAVQLKALTGNLIAGYHRDLQLAKKMVMLSCSSANRVITAAGFALKAVGFNKEKARAAMSAELFATHEANKKTAEGTPFRQAYREVAQQLDAIDATPWLNATHTYSHTGAPGMLDASAYTSELQQHQQWIIFEQEKWASVTEQLLTEL